MGLELIRSLLRRWRTRHSNSTPPWDIAAQHAEQDGVLFKITREKGFTLAKYEKNGKNDYQTYRTIQEIGNRTKLDHIFTTPEVIAAAARHAKDCLGAVNKVLCHGTRNGTEQRWFKSHFPQAQVLGTEISVTATQFPMTILWDFHDIRDDWLDYWDVLYSNSWDHSFSPSIMFSAWYRSLRPGGLLYLEHTREHERVDHLDLFGATPAALREIVEASGLAYRETLKAPPENGLERQLLVFSKAN